MKTHSLTRRLILTVLAVEVVLACCVTLAALYYQRHEALRAFDVMLRGRADSVLASVQDAEDAADNVRLDKSAIDVPQRDRYEVREEDGRYLGGSVIEQDELSRKLNEGISFDRQEEDSHRGRELELSGVEYRALVLRGVRLVDADESGTAAADKGTLHHLVVYYASPMRPVTEATWRAARFFLFADIAALLLSGVIASLLIQRSLRPLGALATEAASVSPQDWKFNAPDHAYHVSELAPLALALDTAMTGLRRAFEQQQTFVNDAAHELKTALTVLKSSLQLLSFRDRARDRTYEHFRLEMEDCIADCGRMEELVRRMLLLARIEQMDSSAVNSLPARPLADILRQVVSQLGPTAALRGVSLVAEILETEIEKMAAPLSDEDSGTLLLNLVLNAIQHSPSGSSIFTRLGLNDRSELELSVIDSGEGIAAEHLPLIFQKFYRSDASRSRKTGGTGLGLSICKAMVDRCGGSISIQSQLGRGTTVSVILPKLVLSVSRERAKTKQLVNQGSRGDGSTG